VPEPNAVRPVDAGRAGGADRPGETDRPPETDRLVVRFEPRSAVGLVLGILIVTFGAGFLASTKRSLTILAVGILLAFAIEPLVQLVQRRVGGRRSLAVGLVSAALFTGFTALAVTVGPAAVDQIERFGEELPDTLAEIESLPVVGPRLREADAAERIEEWIDTLPANLDDDEIGDVARGALNAVLNALGAILVAVVVLLDGPRLVDRLRVLVPEPYRPRADRVGRAFAKVVGTYFAGSLLVATIGGTWVLVVGLVVGVPLAPVAAIWYAVVSLIPQIGGFLGTSFVTLLALTQGVVPALIVLVLVTGYMNFENYVITPAVVGESVDLSPPVTMLAALVGGAAAGVPGALAATPLVGTVKALYMEARFGEQPVEDQPLRERLPGPIRRVLDRVRPPAEAP